MAVRKKDRHQAKTECVQKANELVNYILVLVRPREFDYKGKQLCRPGILGEGQAFSAFGSDILTAGKAIHGLCYEGCNTYLHDEESLLQRRKFFERAIRQCDAIFRLIDMCCYQYGRTNRNKMRSFQHLAQLNKGVKITLLDRMNRDNLIYQQKYSS